MKANKGITLIALVITIIVLLILAGVSIATLTGEHGILTQANNAKERTEKAKEEEEGILDRYNEFIEEKVGNLKGTIQETEDTKPYLPKDSMIIEGTDLDEGLVMKDKNNNEWTWVEVPKSIFRATSNTDYMKIEDDLISYAFDYVDSYDDIYYAGNGTINETEYNSLKNKMLSSIYDNGGFWVSRYEVGTETMRVNWNDDLSIPVSKQDMYPYNYIKLNQAQSIANQANPTENKSASIMFGIQWDLILKHIENKGAKTKGEIFNSTSWGNYMWQEYEISRGKYSKGYFYTEFIEVDEENNIKPNSYDGIYASEQIFTTTGITDRNKAMNIYDLAGNVVEYTLERSIYQNDKTTYRGGEDNEFAIVCSDGMSSRLPRK